MKNFLLSLSALALAVCSSFVHPGRALPEITAESLTGQKVTIPKDIQGKNSLIGFAFSEKSREELSTWFEPMHNVFIKKPDPEDLEGTKFNDPYDYHVYFISLFSNESDNEIARRKWQQELNDLMKSHVLFSKGNHSNFKNSLGISNEDEAVVYVLDSEGRILMTFTGEYSDEKVKKLMKEVVEG